MKKLYEEESIRDIANAIREKNGGQNLYRIAQMGDAVRAISPALQEKTVTENGIVLPDTGYDGLSQVTVQVSDPAESIVGTDTDGNDYLISVDETGHLAKTKLVSSIQIAKLPDKTQYTDGETIDLTGLEVVGYYGDGTASGPIVTSELVCSDEQADGTKMTKMLQEPLSVSTILPDCVSYTKKGEAVYVEASSGWKITTTPQTEETYLLIITYSGASKFVPNNDTYVSTFRIAAGKTSNDAKGAGNDPTGSIVSYTYQGKTVYCSHGRKSHNGSSKSCYGYAQGSYFNYSAADSDIKKIAWSMVYAEAKQTIELKFLRPGDNKEISCSFDITEA